MPSATSSSPPPARRRCAHRLRETDIIARLGGDEFAVILPEETPAEAQTVTQAVVDAVRELSAGLSGGLPGVVTVSIGVALFDDPAKTPDEMLVDADLRDVRRQGRGQGSLRDGPPARPRINGCRGSGSRRPGSTASRSALARGSTSCCYAAADRRPADARDGSPDPYSSCPGCLWLPRCSDPARRVPPHRRALRADRWRSISGSFSTPRARPGHGCAQGGGRPRSHSRSKCLRGVDRLLWRRPRRSSAKLARRRGVPPTALTLELTETAAVADIPPARGDSPTPLRAIGCRLRARRLRGRLRLLLLPQAPPVRRAQDRRRVRQARDGPNETPDLLVISAPSGIANGLGRT